MIRVGFVQTEPAFGDAMANLEGVERLLGDQAADLWVLPELFSTGYTFIDQAECLDLAEDIPGGPTTAGLIRLAGGRGCWLVAGIAEREGDQVFNSSVLVSPAGEVATYRKSHLYGEEKQVFAWGDSGFQVHQMDETRLGMLVCFDWIFPESIRTLALMGADIICHAANLVMPFCQAAMITRCLENRVFAVTANRIGTEERGGRKYHFTGRSRIISPFGVVLADGPEDEEAAVVVEIDPTLARNKELPSGNDLFAERRTELYRLS